MLQIHENGEGIRESYKSYLSIQTIGCVKCIEGKRKDQAYFFSSLKNEAPLVHTYK